MGDETNQQEASKVLEIEGCYPREQETAFSGSSLKLARIRLRPVNLIPHKFGDFANETKVRT
jgi:hypothetical protein